MRDRNIERVRQDNNQVNQIGYSVREYQRAGNFALADPKQDLVVAKSSWSKTGFGSVAEWNLTIKNNSQVVE